MFVVPILKQQVIFSNCINIEEFSQEEIKIIGTRFDVPSNVIEFWTNRINKMKL